MGQAEPQQSQPSGALSLCGQPPTSIPDYLQHFRDYADLLGQVRPLVQISPRRREVAQLDEPTGEIRKSQGYKPLLSGLASER